MRLWRRTRAVTAVQTRFCRRYTKRFGSLTNAYRLAGFRLKKRYCFKEIADEIDTTLCSFAEDMEADLRRHGTSVTFVRELYLLMIDRSPNVAIVMARSVGEGPLKPCRWEIRRNKCNRSDLTLVIKHQRSRLFSAADREPAATQR